MNRPNRAAGVPVTGSVTVLFDDMDTPGAGHLYDVANSAAGVLARAGIPAPYSVSVTVTGQRPPDDDGPQE